MRRRSSAGWAARISRSSTSISRRCTVEKRIEFVEARRRLDLLDAENPSPSRVQIDGKFTDEKSKYLWKNTEAVRRDPERHGEYISLLADVMILAFQTDSTRVITLAAGSDEAMFPGVVTVGYERHCHTLEHQGNASTRRLPTSLMPSFTDAITPADLANLLVWLRSHLGTPAPAADGEATK